MSGTGPNIPPPFPQDIPAMARRPGNGMAVAALVLGILSIVVICVPGLTYASIPCAILAVVFGFTGRSKARAGASGGGMAVAGLVLGFVALTLYVLVIVAAIACGTALLSAVGGMEGLQQMAEEAARQAEQGAATSSAPAP